MFPTASNASPSASANDHVQNTLKEQAMNHSNPIAESAVAGSSMSTTNLISHNEILAGVAPVPEDKPKKRKKAIPFNPTHALEAAQALVNEAKTHPVPAIRAATQAVVALMQALVGASAKRGVFVVDASRAKVALEPFATQAECALTPVIASLREHTPGGREIVRQCKHDDPLQTAKALLGRLAEGSLGVNPGLVRALEHTAAVAQPAQATLGEALKGQADAEKVYTEARRRLEAAVMLLRARLSTEKAESKWGALAAVESAPPGGTKHRGKKHR